jgi:hypothetical protein
MPRNQEVVVHQQPRALSANRIMQQAAVVYAANPQSWNELFGGFVSNARSYMVNSRASDYQVEPYVRDYDTSRRKISNRSPQSTSSTSPSYFKARSSRRSYNNLKKYGYYKKKKIWRK